MAIDIRTIRRILIQFSLFYLLRIALGLIWYHAFSPLESNAVEYDPFLIFLFAPLVETAIFQVLVIELMTMRQVSAIICIITSAALFYLSHWNFSLPSILWLLAGLIYASYYSRMRTVGTGLAFLLTFLMHSMVNLTFLFLNQYING